MPHFLGFEFICHSRRRYELISCSSRKTHSVTPIPHPARSSQHRASFIPRLPRPPAHPHPAPHKPATMFLSSRRHRSWPPAASAPSWLCSIPPALHPALGTRGPPGQTALGRQQDSAAEFLQGAGWGAGVRLCCETEVC